MVAELVAEKLAAKGLQLAAETEIGQQALRAGIATAARFLPEAMVADAKLVAEKLLPGITTDGAAAAAVPKELHALKPANFAEIVSGPKPPPNPFALHGREYPLPSGIFKPNGNIDVFRLTQTMSERHNLAKPFESGAIIRDGKEIMRTTQRPESFGASVPMKPELEVPGDITYHTHPPGYRPSPSSTDLELTKGIGIIGTGASKNTYDVPLTTLFKGQYAEATAGNWLPTRALIVDARNQRAIFKATRLPLENGKAEFQGLELETSTPMKWSEVQDLLRNWDGNWASIEKLSGVQTGPLTLAQFMKMNVPKWAAKF